MGCLNGVRIADFSWAWAGPYATEQMAFMGAEVIKIESRGRLDMGRKYFDPMTSTYYGTNNCPYFNVNNHNKLSITLDLKHPKGIELAKGLVQVSDVVIENFSPGTIDKLGLGYEALKEVNPTIIMLSSSASGQSGPETHYMGYAPLFNAMAGLGDITGYRDGPPTEIRFIIDMSAALSNAFAILAALIHRQRTGEGQYIDVASREAISCLMGDSFMEYFLTGRLPLRRGNEDAIMAPHNCYRCKGEDKWISIAVSTEQEWEAFCKTLGEPEWTKDERFSDAYSRWQNQQELDQQIEEWTKNYSNYEVMEMLQENGVAAVPSFTSEDLFTDRHLEERKFFTVVEHPEAGAFMSPTPPWNLSATPAVIRSPAPSLGQHNNYILREVLHMSDEEITAVQEALY